MEELNKEIDKNYAELKLPIIEPEYKNGKLQNEKEIKEKIKLFYASLYVLWLSNLATINKLGKKVQFTVFNQIVAKMSQKGMKTTISKKDWEIIINKAMKDRAKQIKIKQVIRGNAKVLNKKLQKIVVQGYKQGKSKPQIAKELQKQLGYNKNKAKSIANTEINYYKSEAQLNASADVKVKKTWVYNTGAKEPRHSHKQANGQVADKNGYFTIGGLKTKAPQHFGRADQDINCHCTMRIDIVE